MSFNNISIGSHDRFIRRIDGTIIGPNTITNMMTGYEMVIPNVTSDVSNDLRTLKKSINNIIDTYDKCSDISIDEMLVMKFDDNKSRNVTILMDIMIEAIIIDDRKCLELLCGVRLLVDNINNQYHGTNILMYIIGQGVDDVSILNLVCDIDGLIVPSCEFDIFKDIYYKAVRIGSIKILKKILRFNMKHATKPIICSEFPSLLTNYECLHKSATGSRIINAGLCTPSPTDIIQSPRLMGKFQNSKYNMTSLMISCMLRDNDTIEYLLEMNIFNMNIVYNGYNIYEIMILNGNAELAKRLSSSKFEFGLDIVLSCIHNNNIELLNTILSYNTVDINESLNIDVVQTITLIGYAILINNIDMIKMMLTHLKFNNYKNLTITNDPLYYAIFIGNMESVKLLCESGYDTGNCMYYTMLVHNSINHDIIDDMFNMFSNFKNCNLVSRCCENYTLLMMASMVGKLNIVDHIYDNYNGGDVNAYQFEIYNNDNRMTAVRLAFDNKHIDVVRSLLRYDNIRI